MIRFANGTREVFQNNLPENQARQEPGLTPAEMYQKGRQDAQIYYNGSGAMWGAAASSLIPIGLVGAVVIGAVPPKINPANVPDISLLSDPNYVRGYEMQAHRRKAGKAAVGAGIGSLPYLILLILIESAWR